MRRAVLAIVLAACSAPPTPIANRAQPSPVIVRFAHEHEQTPPEMPTTDAMGQRTFPRPRYQCELQGAAAPELFEPVVAFARAHLVSQLDPFDRDASTPIHVQLVVPDQPQPKDVTRGIVITVQPRSKLGDVVVENRWVDGRHALHYCLRVTREGGKTVVVVEELWSMISGVTGDAD